MQGVGPQLTLLSQLADERIPSSWWLLFWSKEKRAEGKLGIGIADEHPFPSPDIKATEDLREGISADL